MAQATRLALALGGGAAHGFAHIGVLKVLEREGIQVDLITGTSMGALVGAMYAVEPKAEAVEARVVEFFTGPEFRKLRFDVLRGRRAEGTQTFMATFSAYLRKSLFYGLSLTKQSFIARDAYLKNFDELLPDIDTSKTRIPFGAVAGDLVTGRRRLLTHGPLRTIIAGSCAIPGLFPPVPWNDSLLIDGGWVTALPVNEARQLGAEVVIGVEIDALLLETREFRSSLDILIRANDMSRNHIAASQTADALITIVTEGIHWSDWGHVEHMIRTGEIAAKNAVDDLRRTLKRKALWRIFS